MRKEVIGDWTGRLIGFPQKAIVYAIEKGGGVVYVGTTEQTVKNRIRAHVRDARRGSDVPIHQWMRTNNFSFDVRCLEEIDAQERESAEQNWIAHFGAVLLNLTDGGYGLRGHKFKGTGHADKIAERLRKGVNCSCEQCGSEFWRKPRDLKLGHCRFCSRECYQTWQRGKPKHRRAA